MKVDQKRKTITWKDTFFKQTSNLQPKRKKKKKKTSVASAERRLITLKDRFWEQNLESEDDI